MKVATHEPSADQLSQIVIHGMQEKKAKDIVLVDLRETDSAVADFFIICTGTSDTQVDAIADSVEKEVKDALKEYPLHVEGKTSKEWILIDYADVVVHIFKQEKREFYGLEQLWGDAKITELEDFS